MDTTEDFETINHMADIIKHLASYAETEEREAISKARASITTLAKHDLDAALPLWAIAIKLQRLTQTAEMCEQ